MEPSISTKLYIVFIRERSEMRAIHGVRMGDNDKQISRPISLADPTRLPHLPFFASLTTTTTKACWSIAISSSVELARIFSRRIRLLCSRILSQNEKSAKRLFFEPAGSECVQQSLHQVDKKRQSSENCSRIIPKTRYSLLFAVMYNLSDVCSGRRKWKQ